MLWGYLYADRIQWLRGLVRWARQERLTDEPSLRTAHTSNFGEDFEGRIRGLGIAAYCWLVMRLGVDTVKPDVWLHAFVRRVIGRDLPDPDVVTVVTEAAHRVGRQARELDGAIWEFERGRPGSI